MTISLTLLLLTIANCQTAAHTFFFSNLTEALEMVQLLLVAPWYLVTTCTTVFPCLLDPQVMQEPDLIIELDIVLLQVVHLAREDTQLQAGLEMNPVPHS